MSIHPSFKNKNREKRTVRKRWERFKILCKKDKSPSSLFGLPKEKIIKFKIKKEKKEEKSLETLSPLTEEKQEE